MTQIKYRGVPFGRLNPNKGSRFMKAILPQDYHPEPKPPSRRDLHRQIVAARKAL